MKYEDVLHGTRTMPTPSTYPVGKKVTEPETELAFTVNPDDVAGSVVADKEDCAAAKALCKLPDIEHAWVFRSRTLVLRTSGEIERYENPITLARAVDGFDNSAGLFPVGEYKLKPLRPTARREAKKVWNETHKERRGGRRPYEYTAPPKPLRKKK